MSAQLSFFKKHIPPLAQRMRPKKMDDVVGQDHLTLQGTVFRKLVETDTLGSCIFWGPPGSGKTTLASVIANITKRKFVSFNAAFNSIKEVKDIIEEARKMIEFGEKGHILFVDEIHRFNKLQQDAFLKPVEQGIIILIGATTENPSFEVNSALLSRSSVYILNQLNEKNLFNVIQKAIDFLKAESFVVLMDEDAKEFLVNYANGDARIVLNTLELAVNAVKGKIRNCNIITKEIIKEVLSSRKVGYDKNGEQHYNLISALHKSLRGSDAQASLYWLTRMIEGGADPLYIARRLIRFASEDIGLADPNAIVQANAVKDIVHFLGYPECNTALAQLVVYLATAPKSNKIYEAINKAKKDVLEKPNEPVPLNIRNAPTKLMKNLGYGKDYKYDHFCENNFSGQEFLPDVLKNSVYYEPGELGFEKEIKKRMDFWNLLKSRIREKREI